jgi:nucleoid-associated protein YgaU
VRGSDAARPLANGAAEAPNLQALLQPAPRAAVVPLRDAQPVDASASGTLNAGGGSTGQPPIKDAGKAPAVEPLATSRPTYKVVRGDSFDSIAKDKLGRASLRTEIMQLNPSVRPERLQVGQVLLLPTAADLAPSDASSAGVLASTDAGARSGSASEAVVSYTIGKGDTYEAIARRQLGDRKRVADLRELNPGIDPTRLRVGQKIRLPRK